MNRFLSYIKSILNLLKKMFTNLSIKVRLMFCFTGFTILLTLSIGLISYSNSSVTIYNQSVIYAQTILNQTIDRIEQMKKDIMDISIPLLVNPGIQKNDYHELDTLRFMEKKRYIETELNKVDTLRNEICSIYICIEPEYIFSHNIFSTENEKLFKNYKVYKRCIGIISKPVWTGVHINEFIQDKNEYVITFSRPVYDKNTYKVMGALIINIQQDVLQNMSIFNETSEHYNLFIIDIEGNTVLNSMKETGTDTVNRNYIQSIIKEGKEESLFNYKTKEGSYLVNAIYSSDREWIYITEISMEPLMENAKQIKQFTIFILIIGFIISAIVTYLLSNYFTNPFRRMIHIMRIIESGNLNIKMGIYNKSEIGILCTSFDNMVNKLKQLIKKVELEHEEKRKEELKTLQAQITPHFLYNSLNAIKCMARIQKSSGIEEMTESLIELLQMSISKQDIFISIEEEIELVKKFILLQNYRHGKKFLVQYQTTASVLKKKTLNLVLQPIVENAILHGIETKKRNGSIIIRVYCIDDKLCIEVEDNGVGMSEEQIRKILIEEPSNTRRFSGIGIKNVNERIKMYFGSQYGLSFHSEVGKYTLVKIILPVLEEGDMDGKV